MKSLELFRVVRYLTWSLPLGGRGRQPGCGLLHHLGGHCVRPVELNVGDRLAGVLKAGDESVTAVVDRQHLVLALLLRQEADEISVVLGSVR